MGFYNSVLSAKNWDFRQVVPVAAQATSGGDLPIGTGGDPAVEVGQIISSDASLSIVYVNPNIDISAGASVATTYQTQSGSAVPVANILDVLGIQETSTRASGNDVSIFSPRTARFVVDPIVDRGTHTSIQSAINSASAGEMIVIRPGTYTENLTFKAGIGITTYNGSSSGQKVNIVGKISASYTGLSTISNVELTTNGDFSYEVTGANATEIIFTNCTFSMDDNTGISNSGSNSSSAISLRNCLLNCNTTGIAYWAITNGSLFIQYCQSNNSGGSSTSTTFSGSSFRASSSYFGLPITTSGSTATFRLFNSTIQTGATNSTCVVSNATTGDSTVIDNCQLMSGTATPITIGGSSTVNLGSTVLTHANATAISGAGALVVAGVDQLSTVGTISPTTVVSKGTFGVLSNTTPPAGYVGELRNSVLAQGSAITLTTATPANITTISLTPGIWDVSCIGMFNGLGTVTQLVTSISTTSATSGTIGNNRVDVGGKTSTSVDETLVIPQYRLEVNTTTTVYLVLVAVYAGADINGYGRLTATRVA